MASFVPINAPTGAASVPAPPAAARAAVPGLVPGSPVVPVLAPAAAVAALAGLVLPPVVVSLRPSPSPSPASFSVVLRTHLAAAAPSFNLDATRTSIEVSCTGCVSIMS